MKKEIINKWSSIFIVMLLLVIGISTIFEYVKADSQSSDIQDQNNGYPPKDFYYLYYGIPVAQSVSPQQQSITRIIIPLHSNGPCGTYDLYVQLNPTTPIPNGPYYRKVTHTISGVPIWPNSPKWVEYMFNPPLDIIPGQDYFFTAESTNYQSPYYFGWDYNTNGYPYGSFWVRDGNTWIDNDQWDGCFVQYGQNRLADPTLDAPSFITLPSGSYGEWVSTSFNIGNTGEAASHLTWEINHVPSWIDWVEPRWGEIAQGQTTNIRVQISGITLPQGDYSDYIGIISNGGNQQVTVSLHVALDVQITPETITSLPNEVCQMEGFQSGGVLPLYWNWDFGDKSGAYTQNVTHYYSVPGIYPVILNVTDGTGNISTDNAIINVKRVIADFSSNHYCSKSNELITFNDASRGCNKILNWSWDFGDRNASYQRNTSHTYTSCGNYNVTLTATDNESNIDVCHRIIHIESIPPTINSMSYKPDIICYGSNVTITANITDNLSGIENTQINITYPDGSCGNYTMNHSINDTFIYEFYNASQIGQYNFTIWTQDTANNINKSLEHNFTITHCFGNGKIGDSNHSVQNIISGSKFTEKESGVATNIMAYVRMNATNPAPVYKCIIYRYNDSKVIGISEEKNLSGLKGEIPYAGWVTFNFTNSSPVLFKDVQYILTCLGENPNSLIYFDYNFNSVYGYYYEKNYTNLSEEANFPHVPEYKMHSLLCNYQLDTNPPKITNISCTPDIIGFGSNITISADIADNLSGVNYVKLNITFPDNSHTNFTMNHANGDLYTYMFTDTWQHGQYNYTIWGVDNLNNSNSNSGLHFNISVTATISIATLKNNYIGNQFINITDPPDPPQNLTVVGRGLTWNTYYNDSSGENIMESYQEPINYQLNNGSWTPINNTFQTLPIDHPAYLYGYRIGNDRGLFGVYFKPDVSSDWPVAFAYNHSDNPNINVVRTKLVGVGYLDPASNWSYHYLQNAQSSQGQTNNYAITYPGVFTGTNVTWSYGNTGLKEAITMSNVTKTVLQNHPPHQYGLQDASSYLVFITRLDCQNLDFYNASGLLTGNVTINDAGVDFRDALGCFKCALPLGEAYELNNESVHQKLVYRIVFLNGDTYLLSGLKVSDLNAMTFPVIIDPTLSVNSVTNDGYIYNRNTNYNTAWTASTGTISSTAFYISIGQNKVATFPSNYDIDRGFLLFNTSCLSSNAIIDNATLSLYKKDDYSTTDFTITIQNGKPTYPHNPLQTGDYDKSKYYGIGGGLNTSRFVNGRNDFDLRDIEWINKSGWTKLCVRSSKDINGTMPTGSEYVNVYSADAPRSYVPKLIIVYRNQSKIKNTGSTNMKGYLLIQVQFLDCGKGLAPSWIVDNDTVNETMPRTINAGQQLALDTIFNGLMRTSDLTHGAGTYRVYVAFRDPFGDILKTSSGVELKAWWQFTKT